MEEIRNRSTAFTSLVPVLKDNLPFDQLIWEIGNADNPDWVHVSYVPNGRNQILKAFKMNGATKYCPYA